HRLTNSAADSPSLTHSARRGLFAAYAAHGLARSKGRANCPLRGTAARRANRTQNRSDARVLVNGRQVVNTTLRKIAHDNLAQTLEWE
ncbi:hypothetical protein ACVSQB_40485, partial [Bradyrhizobium elkanii]